MIDLPASKVVEDARSGRPEAWELIYRQFGPALTRYATSRGVADPEDVAQDVMYIAASRIEGFTGDWDQLQSWLFTIAYRRCADHHRRRYRRREQLADQVPELADPRGGVDEQFSARAAAEEALAALGILHDRERTVVRMRILGDMSAADVAAHTGLSVVNVRVIQTRALRRLRRYLDNNGGVLDKRFRLFPFPPLVTLWARLRGGTGSGEGLAPQLGQAAPATAATSVATVAAVSAGAGGSTTLGGAVAAMAVAASVVTAGVASTNLAAPPPTTAPVVAVAELNAQVPGHTRLSGEEPAPSKSAIPTVPAEVDLESDPSPPKSDSTAGSPETTRALTTDSDVSSPSQAEGVTETTPVPGAVTNDDQNSPVPDEVDDVGQSVEGAVEETAETVDATLDGATTLVEDTSEAVEATVQAGTQTVEQSAAAAVEVVEESAAAAGDVVDEATAEVEEVVDETVTAVEETAQETTEAVEETIEEAPELVGAIVGILFP